MKKEDIEDYSYASKSPMMLVEEFAVAMLLGHGIQVTEVNFADRGLEIFSSAFIPKEHIEKADKGLDITTMYSSAGRIKLGTAEENL